MFSIHWWRTPKWGHCLKSNQFSYQQQRMSNYIRRMNKNSGITYLSFSPDTQMIKKPFWVEQQQQQQQHQQQHDAVLMTSGSSERNNQLKHFTKVIFFIKNNKCCCLLKKSCHTPFNTCGYCTVLIFQSDFFV